jgi:hypothetical protein
VEFIGEDCFSGCKGLRKITFETGSKLQRIEKRAFTWTSIEETIQIPSSVEFIGEYCFSSCKGLRKVTLEEDSRLSEIGSNAFSGTALTQKNITLLESTVENNKKRRRES